VLPLIGSTLFKSTLSTNGGDTNNEDRFFLIQLKKQVSERRDFFNKKAVLNNNVDNYSKQKGPI
jgi:hypothetical protein